MGADEWRVRPAESADLTFVRSSLASDMEGNNYFYGVSRERLRDLAIRAISAATRDGYLLLVVVPADATDPTSLTEVAGWVLYRKVPQMTIVLAYVEPSYRGLGAWRAMREAIGLEQGQIVSCVLAGPRAMSAARKVYQAKHNWGRIVEWLS